MRPQIAAPRLEPGGQKGESTVTAFQSASTADRVLMILDALAVKADWMHCVSLAATIDPKVEITESRDLHFTDDSWLRRNTRGAYMAEQPAARIAW